MGKLPSGLFDEISDDEDLARFLTSKSQFSTLNLIVKPSAFLPNPKDQETSVSRHGRQPTQRLWGIGADVVAATKKSLYGAAIIKVRDVRVAKLDVFADEPPPRHAAIRKWPWMDDDPEEQKAKQKERAIALASAAGEPFLIS